MRFLNEYAANFGLEARRQLIRAADESGVQIKTNIKVDAPPQNPEEIVSPPNGLLKPAGAPLAVSVTGTFGSILEFFQIINRSEILMVIGNVKMTGISPTIEATFTITPYLLVSGPSAQVAAIAGIANARPARRLARPERRAQKAKVRALPERRPRLQPVLRQAPLLAVRSSLSKRQF